VLVAADGRTFAVRGASGQLAITRTGGDTFATREWLAADGDGRAVDTPTLADGIACDPAGCIGKLADGRLAAFALAPDAYEEDCVRAAVVVSQREAPPRCAALIIDRTFWRQRGAIALRRFGSDFVIEAARPSGYDRPWAPASPRQPSITATSPTGANRAPPTDATPREGDLEAGD
jgi:competence protein ComEC